MAGDLIPPPSPAGRPEPDSSEKQKRAREWGGSEPVAAAAAEPDPAPAAPVAPGPSPYRPYWPEVYHPGKWRQWYDFGNGKLADFACHIFNTAHRALDLTYPTKIEVPGGYPQVEASARTNHVRMHFPARRGKDFARDLEPVVMHYSDGEIRPDDEVLKDVIAVFKSAPNPSSARLFQNWMHSLEGQQIVIDFARQYSPHKQAVEKPGVRPLAQIKLMKEDAEGVEKGAEEIKRRYAQLFKV